MWIWKCIYYLIEVKFTNEGLESIVFTSEGDMRQAVNNLQSTNSGFELVSPENVYKVCGIDKN